MNQTKVQNLVHLQGHYGVELVQLALLVQLEQREVLLGRLERTLNDLLFLAVHIRVFLECVHKTLLLGNRLFNIKSLLAQFKDLQCKTNNARAIEGICTYSKEQCVVQSSRALRIIKVLIIIVIILIVTRLVVLIILIILVVRVAIRSYESIENMKYR